MFLRMKRLCYLATYYLIACSPPIALHCSPTCRRRLANINNNMVDSRQGLPWCFTNILFPCWWLWYRLPINKPLLSLSYITCATHTRKIRIFFFSFCLVAYMIHDLLLLNMQVLSCYWWHMEHLKLGNVQMCFARWQCWIQDHHNYP